MNPQIALVLIILTAAVILFVTERLRVDLIALLVLGSLALTGLVTAEQALSGFSNPAVVTVWAVFILSGALSRTGVANLIGHQVLRFSGKGEVRLIFVIMLTAALMSSVMNNVGVAALMLPVVMDVARRTGRSPSRLLMPLASGSLLGGLVTLIGTPPNILVAAALKEAGLEAFGLFDFAPVGLAVMLAGVLFVALLGRHLLPQRGQEGEAAGRPGLADLYQLKERLFILRLPIESALAGRSLAESRLGIALGLSVIGIIRNGETHLAPEPTAILQAGDRLLVEGRLDRWQELHGQQALQAAEDRLAIESLASAEVEVCEFELQANSHLVGRTLQQSDFRRRYGVNVLAIQRDGDIIRNGIFPRHAANFGTARPMGGAGLQKVPLQAGDILRVQGSPAQIATLQDVADFRFIRCEVAQVYQLHQRLLAVQVPLNSALAGRTLAESRLGNAFGLTVLGIVRDGITQPSPPPDSQVLAGDTLLLEGSPAELATLRGLQGLEMEQQPGPDLEDLISEEIGLTEVTLSPRTTLAGKSLRELHFREKYGLNVLGIWRGGRAYRFREVIGDMPLQLGDALLVHGSRERLQVLGNEPDFLVLTEAAQAPPRRDRAALALLIMAVVLASVIIGWLPIAIAAAVGAALVVLTGCLTMDEAYTFIEWRAVFLIAGMLSLGIALQESGAAQFLAETIIGLISPYGPLAVVAGLFILTALAAQAMPTSAVAVLMAPIAISVAHSLGMSPYALTMTVAISSSVSFLSPVAHPANVLVMGPGRYRFADYIKMGLPLTAVVLVVVLVLLPIVWPLYP